MSRSVRDAQQTSQAGAGQRIADLVPDAEEASPRRMLRTVRDESLANFGVRHRPEIDHRLRREELEVRHRLVRAGNHPIDLIRFPREHLLIARQLIFVRHAASSLSLIHISEPTRLLSISYA